MRPVTRGNPATYAPGTDIKQSTEYLQQRLATTRIGKRTYDDAVSQEIADILATLDEHDITYVLPVTVNLPSKLPLWLVKDDLEKHYNALLDSGAFDPRELLSVAQQLIFVLQALLAEYHAETDQHVDRIAAAYARARRDLITNIGQYCSYCEMPLGASLAVEHMLPKKWFPRYAVDWNNFLLACPICNSSKNDNPTLDDGVKTGGSGLNYTQIADAARGLYLWPSDAANYPNFEGSFQYQMFKLLYDSKGSSITEIPFAPNELALLIRERRIRKLDQSGGHIRVEALTPLFHIDRPIDSQPVITFLTSVTGQVEINATNVGNVPPVLVAAFSSFTNPDIPNASKFHLTLGTAPNVYLEPLGQNQWRLSQNRGFQISYGGKIELMEGRNKLTEWTQGVTPMLLAIAGGNLPPNIVSYMNVDQFNVTTEFIPIDRGQCGVTVSRKYILRNDGGVIRVYADQVFSIEVRLAANSPKGVAAIDGAALNRNYIKDVKQSDRRMARRVNAWLSAVQSVWDLEDALPIIDQDPNSASHLVEAIAQTAALTGFWSIWRWVFLNYFAPGNLRNALLAALNNTFTGTR